MRKSKLYDKKITPKTCKTFFNWRSQECFSFWDFSKKPEQYILSGEIKDYDLLKSKLILAEREKRVVKVIFVKKYTRKFVNGVE